MEEEDSSFAEDVDAPLAAAIYVHTSEKPSIDSDIITDNVLESNVYADEDEGASDSNTESNYVQTQKNVNFLEASLCEIPILPAGKHLCIEIFSTWGDPFYVGLNGLDLFDRYGELLRLGEEISTITADPSNINVLPEYGSDPRVIENLLDGFNYTRDDMHVWLAPHGNKVLENGSRVIATIDITFSKPFSIAMLRLWNFNKSRTHCYRGVRQCRITLDKVDIFHG